MKKITLFATIVSSLLIYTHAFSEETDPAQPKANAESVIHFLQAPPPITQFNTFSGTAKVTTKGNFSANITDKSILLSVSNDGMILDTRQIAFGGIYAIHPQKSQTIPKICENKTNAESPLINSSKLWLFSMMGNVTDPMVLIFGRIPLLKDIDLKKSKIDFDKNDNGTLIYTLTVEDKAATGRQEIVLRTTSRLSNWEVLSAKFFYKIGSTEKVVLQVKYDGIREIDPTLRKIRLPRRISLSIFSHQNSNAYHLAIDWQDVLEVNKAVPTPQPCK